MKICNPKFTKDLPVLLFYEPPYPRVDPETKKPLMAKEHLFQGALNVETMDEFLKKVIPCFRILINSTLDMNAFLSFTIIPTKVHFKILFS